MAFLIQNGNVVSYCEASDILDADQRLFEANEITFDNAPNGPLSISDYLEDLGVRATQRINRRIQTSDNWRRYLDNQSISYDINNIPEINPNLVVGRRDDFTTMTVYYVLKEYLLPKIADFGNPESPELQKIEFHERRFSDLFTELTTVWDWYDLDNSGAVESSEHEVRYRRRRRTRGSGSLVRIR